MTGLITSLGAFGVFLLMVPESACVPVPSEVTLLFSGFAVSQGWLSFPAAVLAATAGNVVGSMLAYGIGASHRLDHVPGVRAIVARWERPIERHGTRAVFLARLLPLARTFVSLPAGARRIPLGRFVVLTALGCLLWALVFVTAGLIAGSAWATVSGVAGRIGLGIAIGAALIPVVRAVKAQLGRLDG